VISTMAKAQNIVALAVEPKNDVTCFIYYIYGSVVNINHVGT
jgi:hypothetical protein